MKLSLLLDCGRFISSMLFWGIMSRQKQNLLWLMIVCCASCQITSSKIMIIGENLTDAYANRSTCTAINLVCPSACEMLIGDFCIMTVKTNTSSLGYCEKYRFNITNNLGIYKVRMNETVKDIKMWFLPDESKCLPSAVLNLTDHTVTCQTNGTPTTNTLTSNTPTTNNTTCNSNHQSSNISNILPFSTV
ncbi:hypothetical protein PO909_012218 [Leuciscus waleckii]